MFLPQDEPIQGQQICRPLQNLGESIQALLGSKENLTFTWAESVRFIIEELSFTSTSSPTSPCSPLGDERITEEDREKLKADVSSLEAEVAKLHVSLREAEAKRRGALNNYLDVKGNIRVFCRVRPLLANEQQARVGPVVTPGSDEVLILASGRRKDFQLDRVFLPVSSQEDVFAEVEPIIRSALDGHNVCIFAYGQTGTGKTFTMEGTDDSPGVVPHTLWQLFQQTSLDKTVSFHFTFSMLEVYRGYLRDLLVPPPKRITDPPPKCLSIQMDAKGSVEVENLTEFIITNFNQARRLYEIGSNARSTAWTEANEASSRSHCLLRITISCNGTKGRHRDVSKLWLIDLGGSERLVKTQAKGQVLEEGKAINLSLSALADVISALQRKQPHVPYRNSKLTQILRDSLGEDSKTLMLVHVSPKEDDIGETVCSLTFATRARGIHLGRELSMRAKEERDKAMEKSLQQLKVYEDSCQNLRGNILELEFLIRKKKEILGIDTCGNEGPEELLFTKMGNDRKGNTTDWSVNVPRFMNPTACSRLKERPDLNHLIGLDRAKTVKKVQGFRKSYLGNKNKDAKIAPVDSSLILQQDDGLKVVDCKVGENRTSSHLMQPRAECSPMLDTCILPDDSEDTRNQEDHLHSPTREQREIKSERTNFPSSNDYHKKPSPRRSRRSLTLEFSDQVFFNKRLGS